MSFDGSKYKAGDAVIVVSGYGHGMRVAQVERKTHTGLLVVEGVTYKPSGHAKGGSLRMPYLEDATPEMVERAERKKLVEDILSDAHRRTRDRDNDGWSDLTTDQLRQIAAMLTG